MRLKSYSLRALLIIIALIAFKPAQAQYCTTGLYSTGCGPYTYTYYGYYGYYYYYYYFPDYIASFSTAGGITNISNLSTGCAGGASGYMDYTSQAVTGAQGQIISFTIANNPDEDEYYTAWIDYNNDGDFLDVGEEIYNDVIPYAGSGVGNFTIPMSATPGNKRLRVRCSYFAPSPGPALHPCTLYSYGEVEDYTLKIVGPCDSVENLKATNITLTTATVSFDPPASGTMQYEVKFDQNPTPPAGSGWGVTTNNTFNYTGLQPGECYYVHVRNNCDPTFSLTTESDWVTLKFCTIPDCERPNVIVDNVLSTNARATWDPVPGAYEYEYAVAITDEPPQIGTTTTYTSIFMQGLAPNKALYVHVRAKCTPTPQSLWRSVPFHTTTGLAVESVNANDFNVNVYPNPVNDVLNIKVNKGTGKADLVLTDVLGKEVYLGSMAGGEAQIDTKGLAKGIYMLKYADGSHYNLIKVVKE